MTTSTTTPRPASSSRPRRGREDVLAAATALFRERGYDATSMSDIAARLGVTKAALYRHVKSKPALLRAALGPVRAAVLALLEESAAGEGRYVERLAGLLCGLSDGASADPAGHGLFWSADRPTDEDDRDPVCRESVFRRVAELLERAAAEGDVRDDLEPRLAARLLLGAVVGRGGLQDGPVTPSREPVDLLLDGLT
ncbi:TetR family transcriptional regulator [Streptomyces sp. NPDC059875]|uniref:TetR family transcriptional regulator n=1 Tax=Streptomyces sp. NPDC059875 TaxID=3346984 RepID=UPI0036525255